MSENQIGEFLAVLRKSKGYTQQEAAERLGVSNKTVSSWETGASSPDISLLPVLAELYEVTCDEIVRGRRLPAEGGAKGGEAKRARASKRLLQKQKANLAVVCWVSGGLIALGVLLCGLIGYALLESLVGFFVGLICFAASVAAAEIGARRIRFSLGDEWTIEGAEAVSESLERARLWLACAAFAAFAFVLPHAFAPVHTGLTFNLIWIGTECVFGAAGLGLALLVAISAFLRRRAILLGNAPSDEAPASMQEVYAQARRSLSLARWRYRHVLCIVLTPVFCAAAAVFVLWLCWQNIYVGAETASLSDALSWAMLAAGALGILSFAITVPVYRKKKRAFLKNMGDGGEGQAQ